MDTKFSSAIHTLIMIAGAETPMTSDQIAESVGTNASYIRKICSGEVHDSSGTTAVAPTRTRHDGGGATVLFIVSQQVILR